MTFSDQLLPIIHGIGKLGWNQTCQETGAQWSIVKGLVLTLGVSLFVGRFLRGWVQERSIYGAIHTNCTTCAVAGTSCHVVAVVASYKYCQAHVRYRELIWAGSVLHQYYSIRFIFSPSDPFPKHDVLQMTAFRKFVSLILYAAIVCLSEHDRRRASIKYCYPTHMLWLYHPRLAGPIVSCCSFFALEAPNVS